MNNIISICTNITDISFELYFMVYTLSKDVCHFWVQLPASWVYSKRLAASRRKSLFRPTSVNTSVVLTLLSSPRLSSD